MRSGSDLARTSAVPAAGTEVVVREWGARDARPLVFWHGLNPFGALQLNEAGPAWADRGFRVVAPAAPGLGESPPFEDLDDYRLTRLADLVADLAARLGLARFDYVGWSWGGSIGMHLAVRHAERLSSLVLLDAGHTDLQDVVEWTEASLEERVAEFKQNTTYVFPGWDEFFAAARERASAWRPALEERLRAGMTERDGGVAPCASNAAVAAAFHWVGVERPSEQLARLGELELPILLVVASRSDTSQQVARFRSAVPHATVVEVDSEHDLFAQAPEETARVVADWLLEQVL